TLRAGRLCTRKRRIDAPNTMAEAYSRAWRCGISTREVAGHLATACPRAGTAPARSHTPPPRGSERAIAVPFWSDLSANAKPLKDTGARIPKTGIPKTGIPKTGIPKTGITKTGITKTGITKTGITKTGITKRSWGSRHASDGSQGARVGRAWIG